LGEGAEAGEKVGRHVEKHAFDIQRTWRDRGVIGIGDARGTGHFLPAFMVISAMLKTACLQDSRLNKEPKILNMAVGSLPSPDPAARHP
jgi:hypothetical protein